jgi:hypothetical protein
MAILAVPAVTRGRGLRNAEGDHFGKAVACDPATRQPGNQVATVGPLRLLMKVRAAIGLR